MISAGIIGATGYVGQQLVGFLANHPMSSIGFISSNSYAGIPFSQVYGQYKNVVDIECIETQKVNNHLSDIDVVFIALPHGMAFETAKLCYEKGIKVIDIGADFRLKDVDEYKEWYKLEHRAEDLNKKAIYGLPEVNKKR